MNSRKLLTAVLAAAAMLLAIAHDHTAQETDSRILRGIVLDAKDSAIRGASVEVSVFGSEPRICRTDRNGRFECGVPEGETAEIRIAADGFTENRFSIVLTSARAYETIVRLEPVGPREEVVVLAEGSETPLGETAASITAVSRTQIGETAATGVDDVLRFTPGFTLFRRTGSRTANPTTQGASLRGINPSGASRTLVLEDSVPLNDPFGGWIPWSSVAPISLAGIEVLRGGSSSLYGSDSIGGTINIRRRTVEKRRSISAEAYGGGQKTGSGSFFGGIGLHRLFLDASGAIFGTSGYIPVSEAERGAVDTEAGSQSSNLSVRIRSKSEATGELFIRGSYFSERRDNGTPLQENRTLTRKLAAGADPGIPDIIPGSSSSSLSVRLFGIFQVYDQSFSAVATDRNSESLTRIQRVPSQSLGASVRYGTVVGKHSALGGIEVSETRGSSDETGYFGGSATSLTGSGGRERNFGAYAQDRFEVTGRLFITGRVRFDKWRNFRALRSETALVSGQGSASNFPDRFESAFSPGFSALFTLTDFASAYVNISRAFRAPTLNELYRGFRVGSIVTLANEDLRAEKAGNIEAGAAVWIGPFSTRATIFAATVSDAVANVTIDANSLPIIRQRQNAARVSSRGFELEGEYRSGGVSLNVGYLLSEATFDRFPSSPELEGNLLPQSPAHQFSVRGAFSSNAGYTISAQARAASGQFDDDQNLLTMGPYFQADLFVSKQFDEGFRLFASVENILNSRYTTGLTPVRTISAPITLRAGVRWN